jgi:hypothetical protein
MILTDLDEARRVRRARCQPLLTFSRWPLPDLLATIRGEHFPELATTPPVHFVRRGPLACICHVADQSPAVYMHEILNRADVPEIVFTLIGKHELLHTRIRPREINGEEVNHPPEFWEAERALAPERADAWDWLWRNLGVWLIVRKKEEGIFVENGWDRRKKGDRTSRIKMPEGEFGW